VSCANPAAIKKNSGKRNAPAARPTVMVSSVRQKHGATAFLRLGVKDLDLESETI
jgi:hypothetical protein